MKERREREGKNEVTWRPVLLSFISLPVLTASGFQAAHCAPENGWRLEQNSRTTGLEIVEITPTSLRAINPQSKITIISRAPKWDVIICNDSAKVYFKKPLARFTGLYQRTAADLEWDDLSQLRLMKKPDLVSTKKVDGLMSYELIDKPKQAVEKEQIMNVQLLAHPKVRAARQAATIMSRIYAVPDVGVVPLKLTFWTPRREKHPLKLVSFKEMKVDIPADPPPGYRQVKTERAVQLDERGEATLTEMLDELGGSRK